MIASVVPSLTTPIYQAAAQICGHKPVIVGVGTHTGFKINIDVHSQLGADIVANVAAARLSCKPPFVVVDMGTATTLTAVDRNGNISGIDWTKFYNKHTKRHCKRTYIYDRRIYPPTARNTM